jgi:hypothetical protein
MILFFEKAWFLWWIFAIVAIVRWFSAASVEPPVGSQSLHEFPRDRPSGQAALDQQFISKAS